MNREIKFRVWLDGKHGNITFTKPHMEHGVSIGSEGGYLDIEGGWDIHGEIKTVPVMQYTGLKDKNGVEIYEGDICRFKYEEEVVVFSFDVDLLTMKATVTDSEGSYQDYFPIKSDNYKYEVIGNIYENKDLIK